MNQVVFELGSALLTVERGPGPNIEAGGTFAIVDGVHRGIQYHRHRRSGLQRRGISRKRHGLQRGDISKGAGFDVGHALGDHYTWDSTVSKRFAANGSESRRLSEFDSCQFRGRPEDLYPNRLNICRNDNLCEPCVTKGSVFDRRQLRTGLKHHRCQRRGPIVQPVAERILADGTHTCRNGDTRQPGLLERRFANDYDIRPDGEFDRRERSLFEECARPDTRDCVFGSCMGHASGDRHARRARVGEAPRHGYGRGAVGQHFVGEHTVVHRRGISVGYRSEGDRDYSRHRRGETTGEPIPD